MRSQTEIIKEMKIERGPFNFFSDVLLDCLTYENAKPYLDADVSEEDWKTRQHGVLGGKTQVGPYVTDEEIRQAALDYLRFAWDKAYARRGLSASRSVDKLTAYCWLLGLDISRVKAAPYPPYGCPKLKVISELLEQPLPTDPVLVRMMAGEWEDFVDD